MKNASPLRGLVRNTSLLPVALCAAVAAPPTPAQPAPTAADGHLQEMVVTARRKEENLQAVSVAITALSQQDLQDANIKSVADLQYVVPSMALFGPYRDAPILSIRGQGGYTPGGSPSVVMYLNEIPMPASAQAGAAGGVLGGPGLLYDLENVQVLKGPQGTLFGRNTTGGAILIQTRRPDASHGGHLQLGAGNYGNREYQGAYNLPLLDERLLLRAAVNGQNRDGFTKSADPGGRDLDDVDFISARLTASLRPVDALQNDLIIDYMDSNTNGTSSILRYVNPAHPVNFAFPALAEMQARQRALGIRRQVPIGVDTKSSLERTNVTNLTRFEFSDTLALRNILSYTKATYFQTIDADGTALPIFDPIAEQFVPYVTRQYTEEAQLQGSAFDGTLDWTAGLFFLEAPERDGFTQHRNTVFGATKLVGTREGERSKAAYAQSEFHVDEWLQGLTLIAGVRYTEDTIDRESREQLPDGSCVNWFADARCVSKGHGTFDAFTGQLGLDYQVTPDTLVYFASRRGFRSGGFNITGAQPHEQSYDPEYVTDFEIGIKHTARLGDVVIRSDAALYRQNYTDIQLPKFSQDENGGPISVIQNTGKARITGFEFQGDVGLTANLSLGLHFSWLDYDFTELSPGVAEPVVTNIPKYKYGISADYYLPLDAAYGDVRLSVQWNWQDDAFVAAVEDPFAEQDGYGLLGVSATWENVAGQPFDLSLFMTNVEDKEYAVGGLPLSASLGTSTLTYGEPRMWGARVLYRFGAE